VQAVAAELANQLIRQTPTSSAGETQQRQAFIKTQLDDLEAKIKETKKEIDKKQTDLANMFSARQIADAQTQIAGLQTKLNTLQANYAALLSNTQQGSINTISVIEPAALPIMPIGPNKAATILLAAAIGLVLAAGAAYLLEYLDDTLKNPDDVKKELGLTTLGAVPQIENSEDELIALSSSHSAAVESYRVLRTNLQFAAVDRPLRTLLITSPAPTEGKSLTAANLAVAQAQAGRRVILVDTDLHRPRLHRLFKLRNNAGVTTALLAEHPALDDLLQEASVPGLRVLTSGPLPPNPAELLGSARMKELLVELTAVADTVVLDSPPATALSDAAILSTQSDGVLLVLDSGRTRRESARRSLEALGRVNARVVGVLLNRMPTRGAGYYYYYYYYHYGHYYTSGDGRDGDFQGDDRRRRNKRQAGKRQEQDQKV
jgi:non-specific protein-tyrosine kinase